MKRWPWLFVASTALAACATPTTGPLVRDAGPEIPRDVAVRTIEQYLRAALKDPGSLQQFEVAQTGSRVEWYRGLIQGGGHESAWLWCFAYNAKNSYGGYVGVKRDGLVLRAYDDTSASVVPNVNAILMNGRC